MTPANLKKFRAALIRATNKHIKSGHKIIAYAFRNRATGDMCPIGALIDDYEAIGDRDFLQPIIDKYGITNTEITDFVRAFDNSPTTVGNDDIVKLGQEMRKRYIKE